MKDKNDDMLAEGLLAAMVATVCFFVIGIIMVVFGFIKMNNIIDEQNNTIAVQQEIIDTFKLEN